MWNWFMESFNKPLAEKTYIDDLKIGLFSLIVIIVVAIVIFIIIKIADFIDYHRR